MDANRAVEKFGIVEKQHYLAHTIRAIEIYIKRNKGISYNIYTYPSQIKDKAKCEFFDRHCVIRVPFDVEGKEDCEIRVRLAHEIGHILWNFDRLENPEILENLPSSLEEEIFSWEFAFGLINCKSQYYDNDNENYKKFVFPPERISATIQGILAREDNENCELISALESRFRIKR